MPLCKLPPKETAVLVLDMQNDFCSPEGAFKKFLGRDPSAIQEMMQRLNSFIMETRRQGCQIIFSQMVNGVDSPPNLRERLMAGIESKAEKWPFGLERGSWGGELYEQLEPSQDDLIIEKLYFDFFSSPKLKKELKKHGIKNLIICGVYAEMCVLATAMRGFTEGYRIIIPKDLIETTPENRHFKKMVGELLADFIAEILGSLEIIAALQW